MDAFNSCASTHHRVYVRFPNQKAVRSVVTADVREVAEAFSEMIRQEALCGKEAVAVWSAGQRQIAVFRFDLLRCFVGDD
jgi:hypothetical protein